MTLTVTHINIPAMSTIGYGRGTDADGHEVQFVGDHRPMRDLGEAMQRAGPIEIELEDWQICP